MAQDSSSYGEEKLGKVFNDSIHGHVELHPLLVKIIDTPQFQRLRNIKQLGGAYLVYPGASHNRFEHSIGVAHLAGVLVKTLRENQPELKITEEDILCVQIAGLCHDLGHGPFSHLFDQMFMPQACGNADWTHEQASLEMFEYLVKENELNLFTDNKLNIKYQKDKKDDQRDKENDLVFIKELIYGKPLPENNTTGNGWPYQGRTEKKSFLYEIVSNEQNGIDVDKFDYFARDCHHLGIKNNFDHMRYFKFARVIEVKKKGSKKTRICSRDKEVFNLYEMFHTRIFLFRRVYQHRVTKNVELMIKDALLKANDQITFTRGGKTFTLSTAKDDMEAYATLTDQVTERILQSTQAEMNDAKNILKRIMCRKLYKLLGEAKPKGKAEPNTCKEKHKSLEGKLKQALPAEKQEKDNDFIEVQLVTFSYGKGERNPLDNTYFYKKNELNEGVTIPRNKVSNFLPESFLEQSLRIFWKKLETEEGNNLQEDVKKALQVWCKENEFEVEIYNDSDNQPAQAEAGPATS